MQEREDFKTLFCRHYDVKPEDFAREVLKLSVYTHARWTIWIFSNLSEHYLKADYDFIDSVSRIRKFREYEQTVVEFFDHPMNQNNLFRQWFLIRVSSARLRRLVREVLQTQAGRIASTHARSSITSVDFPADAESAHLQLEKSETNQSDESVTIRCRKGYECDRGVILP